MRVDADSLKKLHNVLLLMIDELDGICKKHHITYYLNGGNALGSIRHGGFIPWDDDFDIMMRTDDYKKFIQVCRKELDASKWYIQEAWMDWPGCFSKIRLKNTYIEEEGEWKGIAKDNNGIFIDVFELVNAPTSRIAQYFQYFCAKLLIAHSLVEKGYRTNSVLKKIALWGGKFLKSKFIFRLVKERVYYYSFQPSKKVANFYGMSRFHNAFFDSSMFANPYYHKYESLMLPLPSEYKLYLEKTFGDYMKLPPIEQRKPAHSLNIDFGPYK